MNQATKDNPPRESILTVSEWEGLVDDVRILLKRCGLLNLREAVELCATLEQRPANQRRTK